MDHVNKTTTVAGRLDFKHLWSLIKDIRYAMIAHRLPDGGLRSAPLTTLNKSLDEGALYFFIGKATGLGEELKSDGAVNLSYADPHKDRYVSICGKARISEDHAKKEQLFNAMTRAWFPGGVNDPDLELLEVKITHAEFWDVRESKASQLVKMAAAAISGHRPEMGEHKEVHFAE